MSKHRNPRPRLPKRHTPDNFDPGDRVIRARTAAIGRQCQLGTRKRVRRATRGVRPTS